jgi:hypothetical protein
MKLQLQNSEQYKAKRINFKIEAGFNDVAALKVDMYAQDNSQKAKI